MKRRRLPDGTVIIGETCTCGHLGEAHAPLYQGQTPIAEGHGVCCVQGCGCQRFTWKNFVYESKPEK